MIKKIYVYILLITSFLVNSQTNFDFHLNKFNLGEDRYNTLFDIENIPLYTFQKNPAFIHWYYSSYTNKHIKPQTVITGNSTYNNVKGDYIPYEGNHQFEWKMLAGGEKVIKKIGTLYGFASYATEQKREVYLNYAVNPQYYYPYLVSDTLNTGKVKYEKYAVSGGFSFQYKNIYYGVSTSYKGVAASKLTDPRLSIYNSWFTLNFGMAFIKKNKLYSLTLCPELNRQNISASTYLQRTTKYFQFYGFGAWNRKESKADYSYAGLYSIKGIGADLAIKNISTKKQSYTLNIAYNYRKMNTETADSGRNTYKNLFSSTTHSLSPKIALSTKHNNFRYYLVLTGNNKFRNGIEYVYENVKVSSSQDLYSYTKVASKKMYYQYSLSNRLQLKAIYRLSKMFSFHFLTGIGYNYYKEHYEFPDKNIINQSLSPIFGIGYKGIFNKSGLNANLRFLLQRAIKNNFKTPQSGENVVVNQVYTPYLIKGEDDHIILSDLIYTYFLNKKQVIGSKLSLAYLERTNAPYIESLSFVSQNTHKKINFSISLFYMFH